MLRQLRMERKFLDMKAFVKVNNGTFPNVNFFLAWEAFNQMGYSVTCFEEKDIDTMDVSVETPVFAGTTIFRRVIDRLGINYPPFDCYPTVLNPYYGRNLRRSTVGEEWDKWHHNPIPVFVKPVKPKVFIGAVWESMLNLIPLAAVPRETECWVCEPLTIMSEFRVYVHEGDILGVKHYYGDWDIVPKGEFIHTVIKNYKPCPIAYGIDIGVLANGDNIVIEVNDACNLGNYGLDSIYYGEMLVNRWFEIVATPKVDRRIEEHLGLTSKPDEMKEIYFKKYPDGKCVRDYMVKNTLSDLKEQSMKAFAEEVHKNIRESEEPTKEVFKVDISGVTDEEIERYMNDTISKCRKVPCVSDEELKKLGY